MQHAKLSPSSSSRWAVCPASVQANEQYENKSNAASEWGTQCHELGEKILKNTLFGSPVEMTDDEEMNEVAFAYSQYCIGLIEGDKELENHEVYIEKKLDLTDIAPDTFGTADFIALDIPNKHLHVADLKTGHNIVYAEDNTQLMMYAIGALKELELLHTVDTVTLHIVQDRIHHIDRWTVDVKEVIHFKEWITERAQMALSKEPPFNPSAVACKWCTHGMKGNCPSLNEYIENAVKDEFDNIEDVDGKADKVSLSHIKRILDNADLITSFVSAIQARALELMEDGVEIDGYKLVESSTRRKWADEKEVEKYLTSHYDDRDVDIYTKKLLPMTKILKMFKGDKKLADMVIKPQGKPVVAPVGDKRPPINNSSCDEFESLDKGELND